MISRINKHAWLTIALFNLSIVALLGMVLRSKILFSIPFIDFKYLLHAHSHFAFGGWITLALISLLIYEVLPEDLSSKKVYKWILFGVLFNSAGMLFSFPFEGYGFFSILFSTLLIFTTYIFGWIYIKHLIQAGTGRIVKLLCFGAVAYLVLSSAGPFTLAYLLASKSGNAVLYRDAIYTYLHLQYNGFFTLAVFALFTNRIEIFLPAKGKQYLSRFALLLNLSVIPSMFLCYLWHYPNVIFRAIAFTGSALMLLCIVYLALALFPLKAKLQNIQKTVKHIGILAMAGFASKMLLQSLTIVHGVGDLVFSNRPVIIGFLHMVLLGFISLYLLTHMFHEGYLRNNRVTQVALYFFASAITLNTTVLMTQGLAIMTGVNSSLFPIALWVLGILLFTGSLLLVFGQLLKKESTHTSHDKAYQATKYSLIN